MTGPLSIIRAAACAALLAISAATGVAQSLQEATRANVALASQLCLNVMLHQVVPQQAFGTAGFVYRGIDRGINDYGVALGIDHFYEAPSDTAKVEVTNPTGPNGLCKVLTAHMPEAELRGLVTAIIMQIYPQASISQQPEMIVRNISPLPLLVSTNTITRHRYEAAGTVQVSFYFPG